MRSLLNALLLSACVGSSVLPGDSQAQIGSEPINVEARASTLEFALTNPRLPHAGARLIVTGPNGYQTVKRFEVGQAMVFSPTREGAPANGRFNFELRLQAIEEPRAGMGMPQAEPVALSTTRGSFAVENGQIIGQMEEGDTRAIVVPDDQSVQGSLCVGLDCTSSEAFSDFSVLTLKENNTRIRFWDTSNSASFPSTDWELRANDTINGGANQFSIVDYTVGNEILTIEAGAPESALFIRESGQVGLGTRTPLMNLHVTDTNTPAIRLDQDGTGGFGAQSWDMGGNEIEYFVRDASSLTIPFSIVAGAPDDSLIVDGLGNVGMGVLTPQNSLHINSRSAAAGIRLESPAAVWDANASIDGFIIDQRGTGGTELRLSAQGDLRVAGSLTSLAPVELPRVTATQGSASLAEIEAHIQRFGQLPGIEQPGSEGHDLIEFQMQLLEAIQQLTLQNIEQQKEIEALQSQINRMRR